MLSTSWHNTPTLFAGFFFIHNSLQSRAPSHLCDLFYSTNSIMLLDLHLKPCSLIPPSNPHSPGDQAFSLMTPRIRNTFPLTIRHSLTPFIFRNPPLPSFLSITVSNIFVVEHLIPGITAHFKYTYTYNQPTYCPCFLSTWCPKISYSYFKSLPRSSFSIAQPISIAFPLAMRDCRLPNLLKNL